MAESLSIDTAGTARSALMRDDSETVAERVLRAITDAIVTGDIAPGTKLNEPDLARRYGISRGPLREAIRQLQARRLVQITPRTGARVVALEPEALLALYQTREALEGMAARLAAQHFTIRQVEELGALLRRHEQSIERDAGRRYYQDEGDLDFHYRIVQGCGNPVLASVLLDDLYHLMRMYRFKFGAYKGRPRQALKEHWHIHDAIAAGDGELAEILMRRHIGAASRWLKSTEETDHE